MPKTVHDYKWHDIADFPKVIKKGWFAVYYFEPSITEGNRWANVLPEVITTEQRMGSRNKTKFMLCEKPNSEA